MGVIEDIKKMAHELTLYDCELTDRITVFIPNLIHWLPMTAAFNTVWSQVLEEIECS